MPNAFTFYLTWTFKLDEVRTISLILGARKVGRREVKWLVEVRALDQSLSDLKALPLKLSYEKYSAINVYFIYHISTDFLHHCWLFWQPSCGQLSLLPLSVFFQQKNGGMNVWGLGTFVPLLPWLMDDDLKLVRKTRILIRARFSFMPPAHHEAYFYTIVKIWGEWHHRAAGIGSIWGGKGRRWGLRTVLGNMPTAVRTERRPQYVDLGCSSRKEVWSL